MKILAIAGSRVPSDTANSIQVMKACSALVQLGHDLTLLVPDDRVDSEADQERDQQDAHRPGDQMNGIPHTKPPYSVAV